MREIRFRVWNKEEKRMAYVTQIDFMSKGYYLSAGGLNGWVNVLYEPLMQYTGLKDKSGEDIYEGDIIRYENGEDRFEVDWDYHGCGFYLSSTTDSEYSMRMFEVLNKNMEIIGNIHETPEIIKS